MSHIEQDGPSQSTLATLANWLRKNSSALKENAKSDKIAKILLENNGEKYLDSKGENAKLEKSSTSLLSIDFHSSAVEIVVKDVDGLPAATEVDDTFSITSKRRKRFQTPKRPPVVGAKNESPQSYYEQSPETLRNMKNNETTSRLEGPHRTQSIFSRLTRSKSHENSRSERFVSLLQKSKLTVDESSSDDLEDEEPMNTVRYSRCCQRLGFKALYHRSMT